MAHWFTEEEMYPHIHSMLLKRHPKSEGWIITPQETKFSGIRPDFIIHKKLDKGVHRAIAEVKRGPRIREEDVRQLLSYSKHLAGASSIIIAKYLAVPGGSTTIDDTALRLIAKHDIIVLKTRFFMHY